MIFLLHIKCILQYFDAIIGNYDRKNFVFMIIVSVNRGYMDFQVNRIVFPLWGTRLRSIHANISKSLHFFFLNHIVNKAISLDFFHGGISLLNQLNEK